MQKLTAVLMQVEICAINSSNIKFSIVTGYQFY